jgi:2C-methyl-D-erythritol 2,4-cyclodiphosphate synthase
MAIPEIAELLTDTSWICYVGAEILSKLSEQGKTSQYILSTFLITIIAAFRPSIGPAIPLIVKLIVRMLKDSPWMVSIVAGTLSNLSAHGKRANISGPLY